MRKYKLLISAIFFITVLSLISCSKIPTEKIYKKPDKTSETKKKTPKKGLSNEIVLDTTEEKALDATLFAIKWIKWQVFSENYENGLIALREAYVYSENDKLKRIYHWPPKDRIQQSDITGYLRKVVIPDGKIPFSQVAFTQENMKINISKTGSNRIKITIDYIIFPYMKNLDLGSQLHSSYYIEDIIFGKIKEYLASN